MHRTGKHTDDDQEGITVNEKQTDVLDEGRPKYTHTELAVQPFGHIIQPPIALGIQTCKRSVTNLNQLLADSIVLRDLYKKHHWQVSGSTFLQLHELFDKHHAEQERVVDTIAERIQALGGVCIAMPHDVAEMTIIPRAPKGREPATDQLTRLIEAHSFILKEARVMARHAADDGDEGTNGVIVGDIIVLHERQVWFLTQHLVEPTRA